MCHLSCQRMLLVESLSQLEIGLNAQRIWFVRVEKRFSSWMLATSLAGWATAVALGLLVRHSDIYLQLFCDDPKAPEWALLDHRVDYHPGTVNGWRGEPVEALSLRTRCEALGQWVLVHLMVHGHDDLRGALKPDAQGRKPRGDAAALRRLMAGEVAV